MPTLWSCSDSGPGVRYCCGSSMGPPRLPVSPSFDLSAQNPVGCVRRLGFCVLGDIPPTVILWLNSACGRRETMRPWTEAETRLLRARIRKKVSAEENPRPPCWSVKRKARESGLIPIKRGKAKTK
jgi:hypothetical protein